MAIVMYSKNDCSFCDKARELLRSQGKFFIEYKLERDFSRETLKALYPSAKTFPVITIDSLYIGGYNELSNLHEKGKL
jgi:glutaredoxin 3